MNNPEVVVVGAGISGLSFAWKAAQTGRQVLVLEERDRIGGCIYSCRYDDGYWYELGAHTVYNSYSGLLDIAIEAGLAEAEVLIERSFTTPMVHQAYLEPHATIVQPDPKTGGVTVWSSTQAIFHVRRNVATALGLEESEVRSIATPVGVLPAEHSDAGGDHRNTADLDAAGHAEIRAVAR